ncbi:MAG: ATP-dependent RNA helicase dbp7, partial [Bogoriella megaspora]
MAEDSLLLNFAQGDATFAAKRSFSGGRWRDRLTAKKAASNWQKKLASNAPNKGTAREPFQGDGNPTGPDSNLDTRAAKRQRIEGLPRPQDHGYVGKKQRGANSNAFKPDQFVSSLFTSNPSPQALAEERGQVDEEAPVEPSNAPLSSELESFTSLGLSTILASHLLNKLEIKAPTAIQKEAIGQLVKEDSDAFVQAETGSGKTLAYLLPIVQRLVSLSLSDSAHSDAQESSRIHRDSGLFAVVLAPTRELCKQILVVLESLLRCAHWIVPGAVTGGESKKKEKARLRKGINILVATPGRLADHLANTQVLDVSRVRWLVLDEGDRLVELGFENDIQKIVSNLNMQAKKVQPLSVSGLPEKRTTVLCSATMKMDVQRLGRISLKSPAHIQASTDHSHADENHASPENEFSAPSQLKQSYAIVPAKQRLVSLVAVLKRAFTRKGSVMKTMIFFTCADSVDFHFDLVAHNRKRQQGISGSGDEQPPPPEDTKMSVHNPQTVTDAPMLSSPANAVRIFRLHGSLHQSLRTSTLAAYAKSSEPAVLFCTDVASRGLDLPNVDFVIEYDPAFSKDDHLHRIGRTARAGRDGRALIFLTPGDEEGYVQILKQGRRDG